MNTFKKVQMLGFTLLPACLMGMGGVQVANLPVQNSVVSAIEAGITAGRAGIGRSFSVPVNGGGNVIAEVGPYEYGSYFNNRRDQAMESRQRASTRYKISIIIDGVQLNSLDFLGHVFEANPEAATFFHSCLYCLSIHNSGIQQVSGSWFSGFNNLESLDLSENNITGFNANDFILPTTLYSLNLARNNIQNIPTELFQQKLLWLECLDLSGNQITELSSEMFSGLLFLNWLSLSNNDIVSLPDDLFHKVGELYPHFRLNIFVCNNPISDNWEQVDMVELGFSKRVGNKIIFERVDDGINTPTEASLRL
jgi:hypothetical protein